MGDMTFKLTVPKSAKLCKMEVVYIGENMPCMEAPGPIPDPRDKIEYVFLDGDNSAGPKTCGAGAEVNFYV